MKKRVVSLFVLASMSYVCPVAFNLPFKRIRPTKRSVEPIKQTTPANKPTPQHSWAKIRQKVTPKPIANFFERRKQRSAGDKLQELATSSRSSLAAQKKYAREEFDKDIRQAAEQKIPQNIPNRNVQVNQLTKTYKDQVYGDIKAMGAMGPEKKHLQYIKTGMQIQQNKYPFKHTSQLQKLKPLPPKPGQAPQIQQQPPLTPKKPALKVVDPNFNPFDTPAKKPKGDTISSFFSDY